jgi:acyl carrier protein
MENVHAQQKIDDHVREQVGRIVSRIARIDISEIADDVLIREELGIDSLMAMEIVANCETALGIELDEGDLAGVETVGAFFAFVTAAYQHAQN